MNKVTFLAMLTIITGIGILVTTAMTSAIAQEMMDDVTMAGNITGGNMTGGNMTGGNMTGGNMTDDVGSISGGKKCNEAC
jgi:hypothetical protein